MSAWFYQLSQRSWDPARYRFEVWEGQAWRWPVGRKVGGEERPASGDIVTFFYAKSGGAEPGFYGWGVILEYIPEHDESHDLMYFRPVPPSDFLKLAPWWDDEASKLADDIRGQMKQGTLWLIQPTNLARLRRGIRWWTSGAGLPQP
jgi:hypothetical protein